MLEDNANYITVRLLILATLCLLIKSTDFGTMHTTVLTNISIVCIAISTLLMALSFVRNAR